MHRALLISLVLALAACGGGGSPTDAAADRAPLDGAPADARVPDGGAGPGDALALDGAPGDGTPADAGDGMALLTFAVTVPAGTPRYDTITITGDAAALGAWDPAGLALARSADGRYRGSATLAVGLPFAFKVTRGSWATVEKAADDAELANRAWAVTGPATVEVTVARWADDPSVTGNVEDLGMFHSALLTERPVLVYLPPGYETDTTTRYPVLYAHDGQNLFDQRTAFAGVEWGLDEAAEELITTGAVAPLIIVAVGNTADRIAEYTQTYDATGGAGGEADTYGRLLVEELKPVIDARYRTLTDAAHSGTLGSSLGGLFSMYIGLRRPDVFTRLGVVSPSVWWDGRDIVTRVNNLAGKLPLVVWEDIGTAEGTSAVDDARLLRTALVSQGWVLGTDLSYLEVAGAAHNEAAWAARVGDVLQFLFPAP